MHETPTPPIEDSLGRHVYKAAGRVIGEIVLDAVPK